MPRIVLCSGKKKQTKKNLHKYVFIACMCSQFVRAQPCCPSAIAVMQAVLQTPPSSTLRTVFFFFFFAFLSVYLTFHFPLSGRLAAADWPRFCRDTGANSITAPASVFIRNIDIKPERFLSRRSRNLRQHPSDVESDWTQLFNNR